MKANEFVKKFGQEKAKVLLSAQGLSIPVLKAIYKTEDLDWMQRAVVEGDLMNMDDLKRLVASHELVVVHGYEKSKEIVKNAPSDDCFFSWTLGNSGVRDKTVNIGMLRKAIADVELCQ